MLTFNLGKNTTSASSSEMTESHTVDPEMSGMPMGDDQHVPPAKQMDGD